ncbi:MAG TPA: amidohydrolase family protein [Fimbriimonas sp.]|nr:amidohydrolase family protein [Fimbriimonas sp.]
MSLLSRRTVVGAGIAGAATFALGSQSSEFDIVIANGFVIDPESKLEAVRHIGIKGDRIAAISRSKLSGKEVIDASDLVVAPGFIDLLAHGQDLEDDLVQVFDGVTTKLQMESGADDQDTWHAEQKGNRVCNYGASVGHPRVRRQFLEGKVDPELGPSTPEQVQAMAQAVRKQLEKGALGVGFGLEYVPGTTRLETLEMFKVAAEFGASCHPHIRYGTYLEEQSVYTAIEEVMACAMMTGAPLHILHVPSMALGNTEKALKMIEMAQANGFDITSCFYPYTAFGTGIGSEVFADGWQEKFGITYGDLEMAHNHERLTKETFEKYRAEGTGMCIAHAIPEAAVRAAVMSKATMVGSDGGLTNGVGHPRSSGTFARVLGKYSREEEVISLRNALAKMTIMPAKRMERRCPDFKRKGRIRVGCDADITIFNSETIIDNATFEAPAKPSTGVEYVLINGQLVVNQGTATGQKGGRPLRAPIKR